MALNSIERRGKILRTDLSGGFQVRKLSLRETSRVKNKTYAVFIYSCVFLFFPLRSFLHALNYLTTF